MTVTFSWTSDSKAKVIHRFTPKCEQCFSPVETKTDDWEGKWQQDPFQHFQGLELNTLIYLMVQTLLRGHLAQVASQKRKKKSLESIYHVLICRHCTQVAIPAWDSQPSARFACAFCSRAACTRRTERRTKKTAANSSAPLLP